MDHKNFRLIKFNQSRNIIADAGYFSFINNLMKSRCANIIKSTEITK